MQAPTDRARRDLQLGSNLDQREALQIHVAGNPGPLAGQPETTQLYPATGEISHDRLAVCSGPCSQLADRCPSLIASDQLDARGGGDRGLALLNGRYVLASKVGYPPPGPLLPPPQRPLLVPSDQGFIIPWSCMPCHDQVLR